MIICGKKIKDPVDYMWQRSRWQWKPSERKLFWCFLIIEQRQEKFLQPIAILIGSRTEILQLNSNYTMVTTWIGLQFSFLSFKVRLFWKRRGIIEINESSGEVIHLTTSALFKVFWCTDFVQKRNSIDFHLNFHPIITSVDQGTGMKMISVGCCVLAH